MNYSIHNSDNQLENQDLVPELPFLVQIPKVLKPYPNWVCWTYHHHGDKLLRMPTSQQGRLDDIYRKCQADEHGLGFLLTPDDPITVVCTWGYKDENGNLLPETEDIIKLSRTYTETDDHMDELYVVGFAEGLWNVGKEHIRIVSDEFIVPITGNTIGAFSDVSNCTQPFATIARRYCSLSWMEKLEVMRSGSDEFSALSKVLTECLGTPNWRQDADSTDLYEFLYLCWDHPRLKSRVYDQIENDIRDFKIRSRAIETLEAIIEEMRQKRKPTKSRAAGRDDGYDDEEWMDGLHYENRGKKVKEDRYNIGFILENHKEWKDRFSFDSFQHRILIDGDRPLSDPDESRIIKWFGATYPFEFSGNRETLYKHAIYDASIVNMFDPLYDFVTSLEWDGQSRLRTWMQDMCGAPPSPHTAWVGYMTIMQMTARALNPGCMARQVPIWEGPENKGKTRMISILGKPWAATFDMSLDSKEAHMFVQGVWVAEIAELNALKATKTETRIKSFISQTEDSFIPKYSNNRVAYQRRAVFIGTTNDDDYLPSLTGNTRWYPIRTEWFNHKRMEQERNQLFAEAVSILKDDPNTPWWEEPKGLLEIISTNRDKRRPFNAYETDLGEWLNRDIPAIGMPRDTTNWLEIAKDFLQIDKKDWKDKSLQSQITSALKALGWTREKASGSEGGGTSWNRPKPDSSDTPQAPF